MSKSPHQEPNASRHKDQAKTDSQAVVRPESGASPEAPPTGGENNRAKHKCCWTKDPGMFVLTAAGLIALIFYTCYTRELVVDAESTSERQLRAYALPKVSHVIFTPGIRGQSADLLVQSIGQTPIYGLSADLEIANFDTLPAPNTLLNYPYGAKGHGEKSILLPGQETGPIHVEFSGSIPSVSVERVRAGKGVLAVWGRINYKDTFKKSHFIQFCFRGSGPNFKNMTECGNQYATTDDSDE